MEDLRLISMEPVRLTLRTLDALMKNIAESADLGDEVVNRRFGALLRASAVNAEESYGVLISWNGGKIPRFEVGGKMIGWTQNGMITAADGTRLGYYERVTEFGGPDRNEQRMIMVIHDADCVAALRAADPVEAMAPGARP